ncbi:MAG TPA: ABC transporter substrate-binding protein [Alphaproteobacteria bacterium]|jgi:TRAP-type mannitol/chloroaromatic compound transport system substrate-binding protein|nr:ABC transporter substrate-binding protein [Alphaproteobacteria bacterium]HBP60146.1 ABC transporter substrate-binding protein [Alphaproteobacteria bacterium]HBP73818.1 ABC transporter substrate-binding protein [Alphaproteobacteria bacterium]HCA91850.1 ABC transporter substrate-binding protein [Alphaproteobacteria bacterium]HCD79739.1 ABC transporter substrate-binding protein [Alphaproteobacteria bacterium]|tara:strand:- start:810 stop:1895 length:1086 start_codon:yes stop_codon:yes gene_type:complete
MDRRSFISKAGAGAALAGTTALAAPAIAQGKRTLTMVTSVPHGFAVFDSAAVYFANAVTEMTDGQITIEKKAAGELVGAFEVFDAVSSGQADIYHSAEYYFGGQHPGLYYFTSVPFGATTEELMAWYYHAGGFDLHDQLGQIFNLKSFLCGSTNMQPGGWFNKEINSADDLSGLKFRMPGIGGKALELTGASVQSLPGGEIYQALASGAIDGAEWIGPYADEKLGFQEICKFYYTGGFHEPGSALCASFNRDIYDSLTPSQQSVMFNAAAAATMHESVGATANNAAALERIVAQGVKPMEFPDDVWDSFGVAAEKAMDAYMDDSLYADIRNSYNASVSQSAKWLDMADRTFVRQRARVLGV